MAGQVPLERLVGLAIDEADQALVGNRLADLGGAGLLDLWLGGCCGPSEADKGGVRGRDQSWQLADLHMVVGHVGRYDAGGLTDDKL